MRASYNSCLVLLAIFLSAVASAQIAPGPNEVQIGPVDVPQDIQGVRINIPVTSMVSVSTSPSAIAVAMRTFADLRDLQAKIGSLIDTIPLPRDNCRSYSANNPVVTIHTKRLDYASGVAVLTLGGDVEVWDCRENPIPNSKIEWVDERWLGVRVRRPKIVTWPGSPIKNKLLTQPLTAKLGARVEKASDMTVQLAMQPPDVQLGGNPILSAIRDSLLNLFRVDINKIAERQLRDAIDPARLQVGVPDDFKKLNPKVTKAAFVDIGSLGVEVDAEAAVSSANMTDLLKALAEHSATPTP